MGILKLIKKDLVLDYGLFFNPGAAMRNKTMRRKFLATPIAVLIIAFYTLMTMRFIFSSISDAIMIQFADLILSIAFLLYFMMVMIFGIGPFISKIYFGNDVSIMQRMPIKSKDIFASKVVSSVINLLPLSVFFVLPVLIKHAGATKQGVVYYIIAYIGIISGSIIIYSILAFVISILMKYINRFSKSKSIMQFLGMLLIFVLTIGLQVYSRKLGENITGAEDFIQNFGGLAKSFTVMFPFIRLITGALTTERLWIKVVGMLAISAIAIITLKITSTLGARYLIEGINANQITAKKKRSAIREDGFKSESVAIAIAKREISEIFKVPVYAFNFLSIGILMPIFMVMPFITGGSVGSADFSKVSEVLKTFDISIVNQISAAALIGLMISIFMGMSGQSATSSISREGKRLWLMQSLPISAKDQIKGRLISSLLFGIISVLPTSIIIIVLFKPPIAMTIGLILGIGIGIFLTSVFGLWVGIIFPKLTWDNPQEAIKQNMSAFLSMLGVWAYIGLFGYIIYRQYRIGNINMSNIGIVALAAILLHLAFGIFLYLKEPGILKAKLNTYGE